jgi:hypothetical protein
MELPGKNLKHFQTGKEKDYIIQKKKINSEPKPQILRNFVGNPASKKFFVDEYFVPEHIIDQSPQYPAMIVNLCFVFRPQFFYRTGIKKTGGHKVFR